MSLHFWIAVAIGTVFLGTIGAWLCVSPYDDESDGAGR